MATNSSLRATSLRANCLSFPEVLAQSIALISPTFTAAVSAPFVFASAGNGAWFAYVIATIGLILVGININQFARHFVSPGALYIYVARGLGSSIGIICGWALTFAYLVVSASVAAAFVHYANLVLSELGLQLPSVWLYLLCALLVWYYAYTDIQLSAVLMIIIELVSLGIVVFLGFLVLSKHGFAPDTAQLTLSGVKPDKFSLGMVTAFYSYVGFESALTLGDEARRPTQAIPRSVFWSVILSGLFFVFITYVEVLGFRGNEISLDQSGAPLSVLASLSGVELLGIGLNVGITFSFLGCVLACINAGARIVFALARHSIYPARLGAAHLQNETPHIAVSCCALFTFLLPASMSLFGLKDLDIYFYLGTLSTYGFLCAYILVSIAAPVYLSQQNQLRPHHLVVSLLAGFFMLIPIGGSFYPVPAFPFNIFPYLFLLYLAIGGGLFWMLRRRSPQIGQQIERDFELLHTR